MKVTIEINGNNAAFEEWPDKRNEFGRILAAIASKFDDYPIYRDGKTKLRDSNGNVCGFIEITEG